MNSNIYNLCQMNKQSSPIDSLDQVPVALLAVYSNEDIKLLNKEAYRLFQEEQLGGMPALDSMIQKDIVGIQPNQKTLSSITLADKTIPVILLASEIQNSETSKIVSVQPIQQELDIHEVNVWRNVSTLFCHKLGNIITSLDIFSSALSQGLPENQMHLEGVSIEQVMGDILNSTNKLKLYNHALQKITYQPSPRFQKINLNWLLGTVNDICGELCIEHKITLVTNLSDSDLEIQGDLVLLQDALIQLVNNAVDALANTTHGKIELNILHTGQGKAVINIADNGPGIPQELIDKLFLPLYSTKGHGKGVGLSTVRQVIHIHNGTITATNNKNGGALFSIKFNCSRSSQSNM
ncbi:ATP-binding protein [Endozoicomonas sp. SM1973]|uniref:histidine kinase n=1 Tax=Spartinivicinus marinus TaxID=2994442 RepID=A0A853IH86_9GAMM|nr:sensor histidine kinase [Spartinivicinus marinus]MCX4030397.1 ATP-binding protein [Spartinivicinus marinus]NYZ69394.1 ATP-binding protein [Spartinivicinus marinus]